MFERHWQPDTRLPGHGLAFARDDVEGNVVVGHDGGWPGFTASLQVLPEQRFACFAATNTFDIGPHTLTDRLVERFLGIGDPSTRMPHGVVTRPDLALRLAGVYAPEPGFASNARWWNEFGGEVRLDAHGDSLVLSTPKGSHAAGVTLVPGDPDDDLYWVGSGARLGIPTLLRLRFRDDATGHVIGFDGGLPQIASMRKRPALRSVRVYKPGLRAVRRRDRGALVRRRVQAGGGPAAVSSSARSKRSNSSSISASVMISGGENASVSPHGDAADDEPAALRGGLTRARRRCRRDRTSGGSPCRRPAPPRP